MIKDEFFEYIKEGFSAFPDYSSLIKKGFSNLEKDPWNFRDVIRAAKYLPKLEKNSDK